MKPRWFRCLVGDTARHHLTQNPGPDSFRLLLAASGGPRWIGLIGIDRSLARFLSQREHPLSCLGASSGAWRVAALASDTTLEAYSELEHAYIEQRYEGKPTPEFVSSTCREYLSRIFTPERRSHALKKSTLQVNLTTTIMPGGTPSSKKLFSSLLASVALNSLDRRLLGRVFHRGLFVGGEVDTQWPLGQFDQIPTRRIELNSQNFVQALLASGSIPMVLAGESNIPLAGPGHHYDGGVLDYHFELEHVGPILYPHFSDDLIPGWLDRFFPRRRLTRKARAQLVLILPSQEMIRRYPDACFPGREDFEKLSNDERIARWRTVQKENQKLEKELTACLEAGELLTVSEPL